MSSPLTDLTLPASEVTVMKPSPALLGTTASAWTAGPPGPPGPPRKPKWRGAAFEVLPDFLELLLGAAALPAMPARAPTSAHTTMTTPSWGSLIALMMAVSLARLPKTLVAAP